MSAALDPDEAHRQRAYIDADGLSRKPVRISSREADVLYLLGLLWAVISSGFLLLRAIVLMPLLYALQFYRLPPVWRFWGVVAIGMLAIQMMKSYDPAVVSVGAFLFGALAPMVIAAMMLEDKIPWPDWRRLLRRHPRR